MTQPILQIEIRHERDVVLTRQRAREIAALLGFSQQEQTRIATAVSEIARNVLMYAHGGCSEFSFEDGPTPALLTVIQDRGPGIPHLQAILNGQYQSPTGMGLGIIGAKRLMDEFEIQSSPGATIVRLRKFLPYAGRRSAPKLIGGISNQLASQQEPQPFDELQQQNRELLASLEELQARHAQIERLNRELEETNRGVLALYAELDDRAQELRKVSELKSRFLSNMTHELRTPLNSIIMLSRMLLDETEGVLANGQARPIELINRAAESLLELVNDLLDLAKIEAGKIDVKVTSFSPDELIGALRGMFRPLMPQTSVDLIFEPIENIPMLRTDEGKVSQILRNLISNALKFTEHGEVRVSVSVSSEGMIAFHVADTGIGISEEDQQKLFHDFEQLAPGRKIKGTGLGLSLSRRLAELLGGRITVHSIPGEGSTFTALIPAVYRPATETTELIANAPTPAGSGTANA